MQEVIAQATAAGGEEDALEAADEASAAAQRSRLEAEYDSILAAVRSEGALA